VNRFVGGVVIGEFVTLELLETLSLFFEIGVLEIGATEFGLSDVGEPVAGKAAVGAFVAGI
jgi:hypothetical protein